MIPKIITLILFYLCKWIKIILFFIMCEIVWLFCAIPILITYKITKDHFFSVNFIRDQKTIYEGMKKFYDEER